MIPMYPETAKQTLKCPFNRGQMCEANGCPGWENWDEEQEYERVEGSEDLKEKMFNAALAEREQLMSDWIKSEMAARPGVELLGGFDHELQQGEVERVMRGFRPVINFVTPAEKVAGYCHMLGYDEDCDEDDIK